MASRPIEFPGVSGAGFWRMFTGTVKEEIIIKVNSWPKITTVRCKMVRKAKKICKNAVREDEEHQQ